ncbi:MAG: TonB-dependent receptor [Nonlabens sp.]
MKTTLEQKIKNLPLFIMALSFTTITWSQESKNISGTVTEVDSRTAQANVQIFSKAGGLLATSDDRGVYSFALSEIPSTIIFYAPEFEIIEIEVTANTPTPLNVALNPLAETLNTVEIKARKSRIFELKRLKDVEGTAIYAGKKTEVILLDQSMANVATNNARQMFNQVAGLNIFQNDDAGLQLNIGGRGLDPNRTSNFNTRQNGYDISADVLGYPESYYAPAAEGLKEIQVIRGAASLQYGTQFGGLINFVMKEPNPNKTIELITRNTVGNFSLYTNFTSLSGTKNKWSYYTFFNYKRGDGFRPNSEYESKNVYAHVGYEFSEKTKLTGEITYLDYLAQQAGGLTDAMFEDDPYQSNRARNWLEVNWLLYNLKLEHDFTEKTKFTFNAFGLTASRNALGFRTNRVSQVDSDEERDLIKGDFFNYGFEARLLSEYQLAGKKSIFLLGSKFYKANNTSTQGPGSADSDPNFDFQFNDFPNYQNQNDFVYPNLNVSLFGENIFYLNDKLSLTPGFRLEYIKTESDGFFRRINRDGAGNVIRNDRVDENLLNERTFVLLGLGSSFKASKSVEFYGNISQNYRSVTFTDISTVNPAFTINPDISDERGFTTDLGLRGNYRNLISYDVNAFGLFYNDRIGFVQKEQSDGSINTERGNVGDAVIYGLESLIDFNLNQLLWNDNDHVFNVFFNTSVIESEYVSSSENGVEGKRVEFVPTLNFKTGAKWGYKNLLVSAQYTYLSEQFSDAQNSESGSLSGVVGAIPAYDIVDASISYSWKFLKLEAGINNILDRAYFTRRATSYPGPGIIPSAPRNYYMTLQVRI